MKLSWLSNAPWSFTGYGNQTRVFTPRIKALGHDVAIIAFFGLEGRMLNLDGIPIYPKGFHPFGGDVMDAHTRHFGAEVCISLMDAWVVEPERFRSGVKWIPWFPVDMTPLPPPVHRSVEQAYRRIVFSKFGEQMCHEAGLDCYYVPHGVETDVFRPVDRAAAREYMHKLVPGLEPDKFIVGMVAANKGQPSRKALVENLTAFAMLHGAHPDTVLYLHTFDGQNGEFGGLNLPELAAFLGLEPGRDVVFCDQYQQMLGFGDEYMVNAYNAMDVHLLVSMGEGFGIPILEAQACGTPVIVGDWTSMGELCFGGWKVDKREAMPLYMPLGAYQFAPNPVAIAERLEAAYRAWGNDDYRKRARQGALAYDADKVTEKYWKPVLADIEGSLTDGKN